MLFEAEITIPANTSKSDPTEVILKIAHGIITEIKVRPRPGHHGLAHMIIRHHEAIIAPSTEGMDLRGDEHPIDWEEYYESYQPPYELKLQGWNDDDTYQHGFDVFVTILPRKAILALAVVDTFKSILGFLSPRRLFTSSGG